jgi:hypothetical protein
MRIVCLIAVVLLAGCGQDDKEHAGPPREACAHTTCRSDPGAVFALGGTWTYSNCSYVDADAGNRDQIGLPCEGELHLCSMSGRNGYALSDNSAYSWTEVGPNGVAATVGDATAHSYYADTGPGVSWQAYAVANMSNSRCRSHPVQYVITCSNSDGSFGLFNCQKVSLVTPESAAAANCGEPAGWVKSSFRLRRSGITSDYCE